MTRARVMVFLHYHPNDLYNYTNIKVGYTNFTINIFLKVVALVAQLGSFLTGKTIIPGSIPLEVFRVHIEFSEVFGDLQVNLHFSNETLNRLYTIHVEEWSYAN